MAIPKSTRPVVVSLLGAGTLAALLYACGPDVRPTSPDEGRPGAVNLAQQRVKTNYIDLRYVCGDQFRIDNRNPMAVSVTYQVANTSPLEQGTLTLPARTGDGASYSTTIFTTIKRGTVLLFYAGKQIESQANLGTACPAPPPPPAPAPNPGKWAAVFPWPVVALHLHLLPTGKVLSFGHYGTPQVWDPATGVFTPVASPSLLFCAGHAFLPDGRLLVAGGHIADNLGLPDLNFFNPGTQTWTKSSNPMAYGRWYPTTTTLPNGEVLTLAGTNQQGDTVPIPEVYRTDGTWRKLTGISVKLPYYPRTFVAPNGRVFYAGERQATRYLDPAGTGTWGTVLANRNKADRSYGSAVMYEPGRILYVGGGDPPTNTAEYINLNLATPAWNYTSPMVYARRHLNATLLPDGKVLVTGGTSGAGFNNEAGRVTTAEMWDRATGKWTTLASASTTIPRTYHSTSLLLPDARVLHTGSGDASSATNQKNAQIYSPPYLFNADGTAATRPTITGAPTTIAYGQQFLVQSPDAAALSSVTLVRLGSVTHAFDMNQRFLRLTFAQASGGVTVTAPANANLAPPGHYMLFVLKGGVPSRARIVQVK